MSDIDEMDVDEVQTAEKVVSSSREFEKGKKRIAADLPVTIGDNLPWCISLARTHWRMLSILSWTC